MHIFNDRNLSVSDLIKMTLLSVSIFSITININMKNIDGRKVSFILRVLCIVAILLIFVCFLIFENFDIVEIINNSYYQSEDLGERFRTTGMVFPYSNDRRLNNSDIIQLAECDEYPTEFLLACSLNELYSRYGLKFTSIKYASLYQQYEWYEPKDITAEEIVERMNEYELYNLNYLASIRDRNILSK